MNLEQLRNKKTKLENKLFDVRVESIKRLSNNYHSGARYRSMVNTCCNKEDKIKERINKLNLLIKKQENESLFK